MSFGQFFNILDGFLNWVVNRVNLARGDSGNGFKSHRVVLKKIVSGSIIISSSVSLDSPTGVDEIASGFSQALSSGIEQIDGYLISGSA